MSCRALLQVIKQQLADGVSQRRVGLVSSGAPARQHSEVRVFPRVVCDMRLEGV